MQSVSALVCAADSKALSEEFRFLTQRYFTLLDLK